MNAVDHEGRTALSTAHSLQIQEILVLAGATGSSRR
jgi:hypothetical protein